MPMRLCATPLIAPILAYFSKCLPHPLFPSWHKAETELLSEADPSSKEAAPCSRSPMTCYMPLIYQITVPLFALHVVLLPVLFTQIQLSGSLPPYLPFAHWRWQCLTINPRRNLDYPLQPDEGDFGFHVITLCKCLTKCDIMWQNVTYQSYHCW